MFVATAFIAGNAVASEGTPTPVEIAVAPIIRISPSAANADWRAFDIGASGAIVFVGGGDLGVGGAGVRPGAGNVSLPPGGQVALSGSGGISVEGGSPSAAGIANTGGTLRVSLVPEPETPLLLLAGLVLVGARQAKRASFGRAKGAD